MVENEYLVAAAVQLLREEQRSDPGSFDAVWVQHGATPCPSGCGGSHSGEGSPVPRPRRSPLRLLCVASILTDTG
jgi:hypothetical protein